MKCEIEVPQIQGLKDGEITVGRDFILHCTGEWPKEINPEDVKFSLAPELQYLLKIRKFEFRDLNTADIHVVAYVAGKMKLPELTLVSGELEIPLGELAWEVTSSIQQPQEQGKQPEPFGPMGPAIISWPLVYSLLIATVIIGILSYIGVKIFRQQQRKKLLEEMSEHDSALEPLQQFYQRMRTLQRKNIIFHQSHDVTLTQKQISAETVQSAFDSINTGVRVFLAREFKIPAFQWNDKLILKDLKRQNKEAYKRSSQALKILLSQLDALKQSKQIEAADIVVLYKRSFKWIELATQRIEK